MSYMQGLDSIAGAALTPGGVASGLGNLVSALTQAPLDARRIQMEQANRVAERMLHQRQLDQAMQIAQMQQEGENTRWKYRADAQRANSQTRANSQSMQRALSIAAATSPKRTAVDPKTLSGPAQQLYGLDGKIPSRPTTGDEQLQWALQHYQQFSQLPGFTPQIQSTGDEDETDELDPTGAIPAGLMPVQQPAAAPASVPQAPSAPVAPTQVPAAPAAPAAVSAAGPTPLQDQMKAILSKLHPADQAAYQAVLATGDPTRIGAANARLAAMAANGRF